MSSHSMARWRTSVTRFGGARTMRDTMRTSWFSLLVPKNTVTPSWQYQASHISMSSPAAYASAQSQNLLCILHPVFVAELFQQYSAICHDLTRFSSMLGNLC